jgi:hypothetical protein
VVYLGLYLFGLIYPWTYPLAGIGSLAWLGAGVALGALWGLRPTIGRLSILAAGILTGWPCSKLWHGFSAEIRHANVRTGWPTTRSGSQSHARAPL